MSAIKMESLIKTYGDQGILKGIDLEVSEGEMMALVGPSGSGKTTLLKLISSLLEPTAGQILFNGIPARERRGRQGGAVVVFQDYALFPHLSVIDNIAFGLKMRGIEKNVRLARAEELLTLVQLDGHGHKRPHALSGGQQQRVAIARALAVEPEVLLLDEPFSSLDAALRASMRTFVRNLQRKLGITCILVTHDTQDALMTADRIAVLFEGRIAQVGTPVEIYQRPATKRVADFFGEANYHRVLVTEDQVISDLGLFSRPKGLVSGEADLLVRPEAIRLCNEKGACEAEVVEAIFCGERVRYTVSVGKSKLRVLDEARQLRMLGERVFLNLELPRLHLFNVKTGEVL